MNIDVSELGGKVTCVRLRGRLDAAGADAIDTRFTAAVVSQGRPTVVDLGEVSFVASMGLRLMIATARGLKLKGARMVMFGAQGPVQDVLDQAAIGEIIDIVGSEQQAVESLAA